MATERASKIKRRRVRILVVDHHPTVRQRLIQVIRGQGDLLVCGEASGASGALAAIATSKPDMVLADISLLGLGGVELIANMNGPKRKLPVLVLCARSDSVSAERALRAGARGCIIKHKATEQVVEAVRHVLAGEVYVSATILGKLR